MLAAILWFVCDKKVKQILFTSTKKATSWMGCVSKSAPIAKGKVCWKQALGSKSTIAWDSQMGSLFFTNKEGLTSINASTGKKKMANTCKGIGQWLIMPFPPWEASCSW